MPSNHNRQHNVVKKANFRPQDRIFPILFALISQMLLPETFRVARGIDVAREDRVTWKCMGVAHLYPISSMT